MAFERGYQGVVEKIIQDGPKGPYAVAWVEREIGSITFSLDSQVWQENDWPSLGTYVMLTKLRKKKVSNTGYAWRAESARFVKPSDDKEEEQKE